MRLESNQKQSFCKSFAFKILMLLVQLGFLAAAFQLINLGYLAQEQLQYQLPWEVNWFEQEFPLRFFLLAASVLTTFHFVSSQQARGSVLAAVSALHLGLFCYEALIYVTLSAVIMWWALGKQETTDRKTAIRYWLCFGVLVFLGPKLFLWLPFLHWMPSCEVLFQGLFLRYAYLYYERSKGILPPCNLAGFFAYLTFIPQIYGMLNFPPSEMLGRIGHSLQVLGQATRSILLAAIKLASLWWLEYYVLEHFGFRLGHNHIADLDRSGLWIALLANYIAWFLQLSSSFDLLTGIIRLFGVPVENNFRWALLAASPLQLWRRWNIYNRKLLLKFIYFPLGGNRKRVYLNILLTFLASAILLHSGWFGGPWLYPDPFFLLDECLYFLLQGLLVCAAYWLHNRLPENRERPDAFSKPAQTQPLLRLFLSREYRLLLRLAGIVFTLCASAWAHAIILMNGTKLKFDHDIATLTERFQLMLRALGLPI